MLKRLSFILIFLTIFLTAEAQKRVQNALVFDGFDDIVRCKSQSSTDFSNSAFSAEAWIKPSMFQSEPKLGTIVARHDEPSNRGFSLAAGGDGQVYFGVFDDSSAEITTAANTVSLTTWTHVAATFDGYLLKVYINGILKDSLRDSTAVGKPGSIPLTIGNQHAMNRPWWGGIDEVRLWSRALSANEILNNYRFSYCGFSSDLKAYFKFNKGRAGSKNSIYTRIPDWSGYNNEGTLYNFSLDGLLSNYVNGIIPLQDEIYTVDTVHACDRYPAPSRTNTWFQSGTYIDTVYSKRGCDSALKIVLFIKNSSRDTLYIRSCGNYTFPSGIQIGTQSGIYTDIIQNTAGCDSILTIFLKLGPDSTFLDTSVCHSFILPHSKRVCFKSGVYMDTLKNRMGCDSLLFFRVEIKPTSAVEIPLNICKSVQLPGSGKYVYEPGNYVDTFINARGCDSLLQYKVKSLVTRSYFQDYACGSYTSASGKYHWRTSGIWYDTVANYRNCDSIIEVKLEVSPITDTVLFVQACRRYRVPSRRYFIYNSGTYFDTIMNSFGCDSVIRIEANIIKFDNTLRVSGDSLFAEFGHNQYQWLRCDLDFQVVDGANTPKIKIPVPGDYAVRMERDGCADTSECINVVQNGASVFQNVRFNVYPNPNGGRVFVEGDNLDASIVEVRDLNGRIIQVLSFMQGYEGPQYIDIAQKGWFYLVLIKADYRDVVSILVE